MFVPTESTILLSVIGFTGIIASFVVVIYGRTMMNRMLMR